MDAQDCFLWENETIWAFNDNSGEKSGKRKFPDPNTASGDPPPPSAAVQSVADGGGGGKVNEAKGGSGGVESDHEVHIWTERERRKKMRNMFSNLHALLPQLPPKADKSTIVDEAVNYIKTLELTLQNLQKQKLEKIQLHGFNFNNNNIIPTIPSILTSQKLNNTDLTTREAFMADHLGSGGLLASIIGPSFPAPVPAFQTWTSPNVILNVSGNEAQFSICCPRKPGLLTAVCVFFDKHKIEMVSAQVSSDAQRCMCMIHARASRYEDYVFSSETTPFSSLEEVYKGAAGEIMLWITNHL